MKKFKCECGDSCDHYTKCKKTIMVTRPCGRSNPELGDKKARYSSNPITKEQMRVMRKYTRVVRVRGEHAAFFMVGNQFFTMPTGTRDHARFMRRMLAIAIYKLIHNEEFK